MDFVIPDDMPIDVAYKQMRILEYFYDEKYQNAVLKCDCGCNEIYVRKNEQEFRKRNLKHLITQRDKLINDFEHWKGKVERGERERYYHEDNDEYESDTTAGQPPAMLEEVEEELKEVEEMLKSLNN